MKHRTFFNWSLGVSLSLVSVSLLSFAAGSMQLSAEPLTPSEDPALAAPGAAAASAETAEAAEPAADTDAPARFVSTDKSLPPNIKPTSPVNEVIKLANSGVSESVLLAYVTNSVHTFNLGAEEIIYLNDIGVPGAVVTSMMQRDQELKGAFAAAATAPPPVPEQAPGPMEQMPPPDNPAPYPVEAPLTPPDDGSGDMFYDSLAPYGNWVDVEGYGRCWQPTVVVVNSGWQPYFNCGHWVYSDCGWYWLSDYSWGWAPFHYGSWFRHSHLGWCWVPGHTWGPSWVSWRYSDRYCGWAPLPPGAHFVAGVGLTFHGRPVGERDDFGLRPGHYHFVDWNHFGDRELGRGRVPHQEVARIYDQSTVATRIGGDGHYVINNGLPPSQVAAATHRPIHTVALRESAQARTDGGRRERFEAAGQTLAIYRPRPEGRARTSAGNASALRPVSRSVPTPGPSAPAAPWTARGSRSSNELAPNRGPAVRDASPLVLKGAQSSTLRESAPPSSLVIIGGKNRTLPARPQPSAVSAASQPSSSSAASARPAAETVPQRQSAAEQNQNQRPDWRGTVSSSAQPSWFRGRDAMADGPVAPRNSFAETRSYQRAPAAEVPRYAPSYAPQRSYSAPSWSAPSRPSSYSAPPPSQPSMSARPSAPAPSAPSAPAASSGSHSSSSSGRNGR